MILNEIDPVSSSAEILPKIQYILNKLSGNTITNADAVADLKTIKSDVYVQSRLSAEYQHMYINIANISTIFENGGSGEVDVTDSHDNRHYLWSDELNRYLHRDEIFAIIQACTVPK